MDADHPGEFAPVDNRCHALLGTAYKVVRCGRPEGDERHDPLFFMSHIYSPNPTDPDDPYEYDVEDPDA